MSNARRRRRQVGERHPTLEEDPVKYVILIHSNPASREMWESFSAEEQAQGFEYYGRIVDDLVASGELVVTHALADPSLATTVTVREDGGAITTDGPFAEAKEQLAGFFLIDCDTPERAVEIAARMPEAGLGLIEVRPVLDLGGTEM
jgi:hypothetical protein